MKEPITWSKYKSEIISLNKEGKLSGDILRILKKKYGDIFPNQAQRRIREILNKINPQNKRTNAKILLFDLETHPMKGYFWSKYPESISDDFIVHDWGLLSWSAKYLFEDKIYSDKLSEEELSNLTQNEVLSDERISKSLWKLIDDCDILIAHNLKKFDEKRANTKFIQYGLPRPSPYATIDTLEHLRKRFELASNRLDYVAKKFFGIEGKLKTETGLWMRCMNNDYAALKYMEEYNNQDVRVLESLYLEIRGWIVNHPNVALQAVSDTGSCPTCGSSDNEDCKTPYRTYVNEYDAFRCTNCGNIFRTRKSKITLKDKKYLKIGL